MILFIVIISLIIFWGIANELYKRSSYYRSIFADVIKFGTNGSLEYNLQIVNIGSNHPKYGFDWSITDMKGENCAVGPQAFEYDYIILKHISTHLSKGAVVVIPICLLNFFLYRFENSNTYLKYYLFLNPDEIINYSRFKRITRIDFPLLRNPINLLRAIRYSNNKSSLKLCPPPHADRRELEEDADTWVKGWEQQFNISLPNPTLSDKNRADISKNIEILRNILLYCKDHDFKPVLAILPVTKYLSSKFSDDFINNHILNYLNEANVVNAPLLNYLKDERFSSPNLYFNSFFMNKVGRQEFTKEFIKELNERSII